MQLGGKELTATFQRLSWKKVRQIEIRAPCYTWYVMRIRRVAASDIAHSAACSSSASQSSLARRLLRRVRVLLRHSVVVASPKPIVIRERLSSPRSMLRYVILLNIHKG